MHVVHSVRFAMGVGFGGSYLNRLKFKTAGKLPIIFEESVEYTPS